MPTPTPTTIGLAPAPGEDNRNFPSRSGRIAPKRPDMVDPQDSSYVYRFTTDEKPADDSTDQQ
jgi:hypothetical protein